MGSFTSNWFGRKQEDCTSLVRSAKVDELEMACQMSWCSLGIAAAQCCTPLFSKDFSENQCVFLSWCSFQHVLHPSHEQMLGWSFSGARRPRWSTKPRDIFTWMQWQGGPSASIQGFLWSCYGGAQNSMSPNFTTCFVSVTLGVEWPLPLGFSCVPFVRFTFWSVILNVLWHPVCVPRTRAKGLWCPCSWRTRCSALLCSQTVLLHKACEPLTNLRNVCIWQYKILEFQLFTEDWRAILNLPGLFRVYMEM